MKDETEELRRLRQAQLNAEASDRQHLEARHGKVWNTDELTREYDVIGFGAPLVVVRRKSDGAVGSMEFQHYPRFYFNWVEDKRL